MQLVSFLSNNNSNSLWLSVILIDQLFEYKNQNVSTRLVIGLIKNLIQLLGYSNLFDFDQLIVSIQIGSIEKTSGSQTLQTGKYSEKNKSFLFVSFFCKTIAYSVYQRSFIEINEQKDILVNKMNDEFDSTSMINNEKRTSSTKLVNQLYFFN